jgi:hypothetical protein
MVEIWTAKKQKVVSEFMDKYEENKNNKDPEYWIGKLRSF